jgi:hypothetical protein
MKNLAQNGFLAITIILIVAFFYLIASASLQQHAQAAGKHPPIYLGQFVVFTDPETMVQYLSTNGGLCVRVDETGAPMKAPK